MEKFLHGFLLPMLLLSAALLDWNLISLVNLLAFLAMQYAAPKIGSEFWRRYPLSRCIFIFSFLAVLFHAIFYIVVAIEGDQWNAMNAQWAKILGFVRYQSWLSPSEFYFLVIQILVAVVCTTKTSESLFVIEKREDSHFEFFCYSLERIGSHLKIVCYLLLPGLQLMVGISYPSWASFPFFICSSTGLVNWSLTSNFLGLFWGWKYLLSYAGLNIFLLHVYQLPIEFSENFICIVKSLGLYKVSTNSEPSEICSGLSLILFYILLSWIRCDLAESDIYKSTMESDLNEQLLPSQNSFFCESRAGLRHGSILFWRMIFQTFSINFFTYGFPISLFVLSLWSFHFASLCSFGLLAYVGYILYAFPSLFRLHCLNGLLLGFILLWAASTYVFNLAFTVLNRRLHKDMEIWETIGLWHYSVPGFYLLAQFGLGVLVAMGNLVNSFVFLSLSDGDREFVDENQNGEDKEAMKVLVVATVVWILRKTSRAFLLYILFLVAIRPGFIHAAYMIFFLVYLLSHTISAKMCQALILLCEAHFALLYILQLNLISKLLDQKGGYVGAILAELGLYKCEHSGDFLKIAVLICFCTIQSHGIELLFSFSTIVQQSPSPPIGFSILKAGLIKSVIFSVYTSRASERHNEVSSHERRIVMYLSAVGQKFLSVYRSCGTYISFLTILLPVYLVIPNYVSCGYLFFLLVWVIGRQLLEKTTKSLWFPLKLYAVSVFLFIYTLSVFSKFRVWLSRLVNLYSIFGYNPEASILENVWESLAILISIQLFSYERRRSKYTTSPNGSATDTGNLTFAKRLLILHGEKILYLAILYASLSPVSALGCLYLLGLIIFSILPKSSQVPSKLFLVYSGLYAMTDYLFQMWGHRAEMLPGQKNYYLSLILGLQLHEPGFQGLESGLRGKIMVIIACILQYNIYHWLDKTPYDRGSIGYEACTLFDTTKELFTELTNLATETRTPSSSSQSGDKKRKASQSRQYIGSGLPQGSVLMSSEMGGSQGSKSKDYLYTYFWESCKGSNKWNRKRIIYFRKERLHKQKMMLKIDIKYWIENMFNLFGLEINMVALLVASFAVLNAISLVYVAALATCIFLHRSLMHRIWPMFVFLFASIVGLEYLALWWNLISEKQDDMGVAQVSCHDCWRISDNYLNFCKKCWLGAIVDDSRMLVSYYVVFMFSCFKLHADHLSSLPASQMFRHLISHNRIASSLNDLSFETKELWTLLDYLRHYTYCHLLDLVLALMLITGTLEYDILHLGYLGFALIFFRMRLEILDKKNKIFKFLRIYNFTLIVLSLAYQSPFVGDFIEGKSATIDFISEVIGFYKYDYGFRITSRSALVEIIIFMLVALQSSMFSSEEFDYVSKYLEAEQIGAIVREQEKRTAWKTAQLQHIRKSEEQKRQRNLQVEKIKSEMLNLQIKLHNIGTTANHGNNSSEFEELGRSSSGKIEASVILKKLDDNVVPHNPDSSSNLFSLNVNESPKSDRNGSPNLNSTIFSVDSPHEISEVRERDFGMGSKSKSQSQENPLISAVHLIGDGVSQVQSLSNQAVNNLVSFLNIENGNSCANESSSEEEVYYEIESYNVSNEQMERTASSSSSLQVGVILRFIWAQMRSNNEIVCYMCFVLIFLWNFSVLSIVYLAALFLYALCVNTGPTYMFWVIMLIYSEVCISLQYVYQIMIQHCGLSIQLSFLEELGFPTHKIESSFVIVNFPLFLVYLFTLLQTTIAARDGNWKNVANNSSRRTRHKDREEASRESSCSERICSFFLPIGKLVNQSIRSLCRYWKSLTEGAETPPYFVQVSMEVKRWPEDGIQPARIESGINKVLRIMYDRKYKSPDFQLASRVRVQSIERSTETPNIALAVFEVLRASPSVESTPLVWHKSLTPAADVAHEILTANDASLFKQIRFPYPIILVIGGGKREIDLYAYIFCADLAVFFLVSMFYQSIIKNKSEFLEVYQLEDQFPKEFVFILMVIFFLIVLDRVIYLCSFAKGKVIFYLFSLGLFTYSAARYAWYTAPPNKHAGRLALRAIYLTKAVSLALQAVQIRFGIPHESSLYRQFLTSNISKLNYMGFRLYRALPFLYELRCVLDWSCTTTSLTVYDWLKLEDIHASLFLVKCDAILNRAGHKTGERQTKRTKFYGGICLFFVLICVIWMPMLMYSSGNPTNIANPIKDASVQVDIKTESGRLTLFETTLCEKLSWEDLAVENDMDPLGYLNAYDVKDIQLICCQADASTLWLVPPVVQARFSKSLAWSMKIIFSWQLTRDRPKGKEAVKYELDVEEQNLPQPSPVMEVLNGSRNSFTIYDVYPRYFRVTGSGDVRLVEQAFEFVSGDLVLNRGNPEWWSFHDIDAPRIRGCGSLAGPMAIVVSEETPQGILGETLSKFSIWGLYITFVLAVGRFIRLQCADLRMRIPYENLPSCDRLLAICEDIYAARAEGELEVEEVLYWTLVKIYRSPHMLLEYTKPD